MIRAGTFLIREVTGFRLLPEVQCRARSSVACPVGHSKIKDEADEPQHARPFMDIPGPKALPLLGNWFRFLPYIGEYDSKNQVKQLQMLRDKYGNIVKVDGLFNLRTNVFLFSPELCEKMYRVQGKWPIRMSLEVIHYYRKNRKHIFGDQMGFVSQGESWHDFRSKVNPYMMHPRAITQHTSQISEVTDEFVEKMRAMRDAKSLELPRDFIHELYKWSLESICSVALNCRLGCLKPNLTADSEPQILINCVHEMFDLLYRMEVLPSLWKVYNTRTIKKFFHVMDTITGICGKYIELAKRKTRETTDNTNLQPSSVLEKLLRIDEQIAHIMAMDMLTAGVDTTGNVAGGILYYIANNPEKQEKLREEVMSVLPDKTSPITSDVLEQAKYAKACIKEAMRKFSIANGNLRTMPTDVCIGGYKIPAGINVIACHQLIAMDPTQFPQPHKYIPERWLRDGNKEFPSVKDANPFAYMPFGFGSRSCVGRRFAELEIETLLLKVIRNFRIEWHHGPLQYESRLINRLVSPMRFKLVDV